MKPKLYVATPVHSGDVKAHYLTSLLQVTQAIAAAGGGMELDIHNGDSLIHRARNVQAYNFLQSDCSHFFCWDSDEAIEPAGAVIALTNLKLDMVGLPVPLKKIHWDEVLDTARGERATAATLEHAGKRFAFNPLDGQSLAFGANGCAEVDVVGTGALLVSRHAMTEMAAHAFATGRWFVCKREPWFGVRMPLLFDMPLDDEHDLLSEDYAFCRTWRSLGGKVWLYSGARVTHVGQYPFVGDIGLLFDDHTPLEAA